MPTEEDLQRHVIKHVGKDWRAFSSYLGVPSSVIDREEMGNPVNVKEAFFQSLLWWHRGNSKEHPSTWEELLQALQDADLMDYAEELRLKLLHNKLSKFLW